MWVVKSASLLNYRHLKPLDQSPISQLKTPRRSNPRSPATRVSLVPTIGTPPYQLPLTVKIIEYNHREQCELSIIGQFPSANKPKDDAGFYLCFGSRDRPHSVNWRIVGRNHFHPLFYSTTSDST